MATIFSGFKKKKKANTLKDFFSSESKTISNTKQNLNSGEYYKSCSDLPLKNFISIVVSGSLEPLIIKGNPTDTQLSEAWAEIFTEYCDIMPSKNSIYVVQLTREIKHLESKIAVIQSIIDAISQQYIPDLIPILQEYGFNYEFTPETMFTDLQGVISESKMFVVQKQVKEGEYERFLNSQKGDPAKETDYDEILAALSKYQGYQLKTKDLSVSEFVAIFNQYNKQGSNGK